MILNNNINYIILSIYIYERWGKEWNCLKSHPQYNTQFDLLLYLWIDARLPWHSSMYKKTCGYFILYIKVHTWDFQVQNPTIMNHWSLEHFFSLLRNPFYIQNKDFKNPNTSSALYENFRAWLWLERQICYEIPVWIYVILKKQKNELEVWMKTKTV